MLRHSSSHATRCPHEIEAKLSPRQRQNPLDVPDNTEQPRENKSGHEGRTQTVTEPSRLQRSGGRVHLSRLRRLGRRDVQEVPDDDRVVVRAADNLEVVELQSEHAAGVLLQSQHDHDADRSFQET